MSKLLCFTKYECLGASSRYRLLQYLPYLTSAGWEVELEPLLSNAYVKAMYGRRPGTRLLSAAGIIRRMSRLSRRHLADFDVVYLQAELLPHLPFALESRFYSARPVVVDYDDATFETYRTSRLLRDKISNVMKASAVVVTGNDYIKSYARRFNPNVHLIPTTVDTRRYAVPGRRTVQPVPVIGWIGTPITIRYIYELLPALQNLARERAFLLRCVGVDALPEMDLPKAECVRWTEESEASLISQFDIGIMPLEDGPFERGKSGLKLLQYMACGIPCVGSAVGANKAIISHGKSGYLADQKEDFVHYLKSLIDDGAARARMGEYGREVVRRQFSLEAWAPTVNSVLESATRIGSAR